MAKKRRDKEHDSSTVSKVAKVGVAALAVGGSAALFNNSALKKKLVSETLPSATKAGKAISKELRDLKSTRSGLDKRTTGKDLQKAWNIGKKAFKENNEFLKNNKSIKLDPTKKKNLFGTIKHFEQLKASDALYQIKDNLKSELQKKEIFELASSKFKDKDANIIKNLAKEAYAKIDEHTIKSDNGELGFSDFLSKRFKKAGFTDDERHEFLTAIYNSNKDISEKVRNGSPLIKRTQKRINEEFDKTILESKKRGEDLYGTVNKLVKKFTDKDIDSEMLFAGSRPMTLKDFKQLSDSDLFNQDDFNFQVKNVDGKNITKNLKDLLNNFKDLDDDTIFDKAIRIDKDGNVFSTAEIRNIGDKAFRDFSSSTLGRLFGLTDVRLDNDKAAFATFKALSTGKEAGYELGHKAGETILMNSKVAIANPTTGKARLFETTLDDFDNLIMSDAIAEGKLRNNMHGKSARLTKEILGTNKDILTADDSDWAQALDLNQTGAPSVFTKIKSKLTAKSHEDYSKNILKRQKKFLTSDKDTEEKILTASMAYLKEQGLEINESNLLDAQAQIANKVLKDNKELSSMLNSITALHQINDDSISSLLHSGTVKDNDSIKILQALNNKEYSSAEDLLNLVSNNGDLNLFNKDLENIVKRGLANSDYIESMQNISQVGTKNILGYSMDSTNVMNIEDIIKRESIKEVLLRESAGGTKGGIEALENVIQNSNLTKEQSKNLRYLANWSIMQSNLELYNDVDAIFEINQLVGENSPLRRFDELLTTSGAFRDGYTSMIDDLGARHKMFESVVGNINESYINEYNNYSFMKESALSRLNQIGSINDAIKTLGEAGKELVAGRNNLNDYTTLTQIPQFMVARLSWGVENIGLNLSHNSTSSTLDMIKNIGLKRIAPIAGAFALYDYMNYESENFTGVSITGASANALANVDKASRRLAYATGIGQAIDWWKESSVIGDYWTGSTDFQTAEERQD